MAKNPDGNPLERHVEKIVLGVCALVAIVILAGWVVSSPRTVEVLDPSGSGSTTAVPPSQADENLAAAGRRIRNFNRDANPSPLPRLGWLDQFAAVAKHPFPPIATLDVGTTSLPLLRRTPPDPNALASLPELSAMVQAPARPAVWCDPEVRQPAEGQSPTDEIILHAAAVYPWADLKARWDTKISRLPNANMAVLRVEVQIQSRSPDASYEGNEGAPARLIAQPPMDSEKRPLQIPVIPDYDGRNAAAVRAAVEELRAWNWQRYILTPPFGNVFLAKVGWVSSRIHLPDNEVSESAEAGPVPAAAPGVLPARAPAPVIPDGRPVAPPPSDSRFGPGDGRTAPPPEGMPPARIPAPAVPGIAAAPALGGIGPVWSEGVEPVGEVKARKIPDLAQQEQAGKVLVAAHVGGLQIGRFYRIRVRVVFVNPLLTQESVQDKTRDSTPKEIASPWSEWSQERLVENPTRFFLTSPSPSSRLRAVVFTRKMGQTVKQTQEIEPGMSIGSPVTVKLANPMGIGTADQVVDFSTGCTAVECELKRVLLKTDIMGVRTESATSALLYLDEKGRLRTRLQADDESNSDYLRLLKESTGSP